MANCNTCEHKKTPQGGHCYMFEREPEDCRAHTQGLSTGAIGDAQRIKGSTLGQFLYGPRTLLEKGDRVF